MIRFLRHALLAGCALGLLGATARPARAGLSLTLDTPDQTVAAPSSGTIGVVFNGTYTLDPGFSVFEIDVDFPFQNGSPPGLVAYFPGSPFPPAGGDTYTGTLFAIQVDSTSAPGYYNEHFGGGPANITVIESNDNGVTTNQVSASFTVTVTDAQVVPEPSSLVAAASGMVAGVVVMGWRRRRQAR